MFQVRFARYRMELNNVNRALHDQDELQKNSTGNQVVKKKWSASEG